MSIPYNFRGNLLVVDALTHAKFSAGHWYCEPVTLDYAGEILGLCHHERRLINTTESRPHKLAVQKQLGFTLPYKPEWYRREKYDLQPGDAFLWLSLPREQFLLWNETKNLTGEGTTFWQCVYVKS